MSNIRSFEDLIVCQRSQDLYIELYQLFHRTRLYFYRDQILRAALSVSNNIAEGNERGSRKDYRKFLIIAKSSCAEVRSMLYLTGRMEIQESVKIEVAQKQCIEIGKMLYAIIRKLQQ